MITPKIAQDMRDEISALGRRQYEMLMASKVIELTPEGPMTSLTAKDLEQYDANAIRINQLRYELKKWEEIK